ncbi:PREDICTED: uncharacterized protein LOC108965600 isoform X2 [Bactrocera latifrons]|uniref:uncharacterized protein LOC108965600 isoform X2 n=1 Tax=Bactrocera latifrons TaxID=174628 RepID=UPI0008DC6F02|nr:PREDICTED: uncharacterized protein LOC108965600 isoform X2 [Bactrocera latifrons]
MPAFCAVQNCGDKYGHAENISFHKFPFKRQELMKKWLDFAQRGPDWQPSKWSAICSRHFRDDDFNCAPDRKILKKTAVPCLHNQKHVQTIEKQYTERKQEDIAKETSLQQTATKTAISSSPATETYNEACEEFDETAEQRMQTTSLQSSPNAPNKYKCRLCGSACSAVVSFSTNFEIYGMIQKCFPTLNIQKDDNLPKEMCRLCLKRVESFSRFIDKVLETQSELQRKYRTEKKDNNTRFAERPLKVKQEPVVRVKQELPEGFDSFLSDDLDMGMDEGCEPEHDSEAIVEQKYDFCDFPMLNAQDIINNCDIMEIINLDDPFINIPDDDANTNCENNTQNSKQQDNAMQQQQQERNKRTLLSAHELLQNHLLSEEHNYAYTTEDLKEECQFKSTYKTEKTDGGECGDRGDFIANVGTEDDEQTGYAGDEHHNVENGASTEENYAPPNIHLQNVAASNVEKPTTAADTTATPPDTRSTRPIVTSVSELSDASITLPNRTVEDHNRAEKLVVTAVDDIPASNSDAAATATKVSVSTSATAPMKTHPKPNIVVLDESIVKSSNAFQLHTCHNCHLKFFSIETLNQHYIVAHQTQAQMQEQGTQMRVEQEKLQSVQMQQLQQLLDPYNPSIQQNMVTQNHHYQQQQQQQQQQHDERLPMVSVPGDYVWKYYAASNDVRSEAFNNNCKLEKGFCSTTACTDSLHKTNDTHTFLQPNVFGFEHSNAAKNSYMTPNCAAKDTSSLNGAPNAVRILEMKRTFLRQHDPFSNMTNIQADYLKAPLNNNDVTKSDSICAVTSLAPENSFKTSTPAIPPTLTLARMQKPKRSKRRVLLSRHISARLTALERKINAKRAPDVITAEYRQLGRRYKKLQLKCKSLQILILEKQRKEASSKSTISSATKRLRCRFCRETFKSIQRLLQHKRTLGHWARRTPKRFASTCCGCEKFFRHKIALHNHMRYICQALPLRCFKMQMQTFKCRYCRRSTFNHWRLYRRHEVKCKFRRQRRKQRSRQRRRHHYQQQVTVQPLTPPNKQRDAALRSTHALLANARQSKQKAAATTRTYACILCAKVFASANRLSQHRITHSDQRRHQCSMCERAYKRRNGLMQHVRAFHLKLKPHQCVVCQRSYALKSDMLRCRHAAVKRARLNEIACSAE